jgi:hypothetical protein
VKCDESKVESATSAAMEFSEIPDRSTTPPINQTAKETEPSTSRRRSESSLSSESESSSSSEYDDNRKNRKIRKLEKRLSEMESRSKFPTQGDEKIIPEFNPQQSSLSIDAWVRRVDEIAEVYGWNDLMTIRVMSNRLTGMARKWYDSQEYFKANWKNIKHKLEKQFAKPLPFAKLLKEAALYETHEGQDLGEYCFTKLDKLRALKLKIPESSLVDAVIGGVTDENMARTARASRFGDVNELYSYLSTLGEMPRVPRGRYRLHITRLRNRKVNVRGRYRLHIKRLRNRKVNIRGRYRLHIKRLRNRKVNVRGRYRLHIKRLRN